VNPAIQYCKTRDGVSIGCYALGDGPPLVMLPYLPMSHLQLEWQTPELREWVGWFAGHRRLIRYDARGTATSDRAPADVSLEAHVEDLIAAMDRFEVERADLIAASFAGPVALAFAALHPHRVRKLALWTTHAKHGDVDQRVAPDIHEQRLAMEALIKVDVDLFLRTWLHRAVGWMEGVQASLVFDLVRQSIDGESFPRMLRAYRSFDARQYLSVITAPTLVMHRRDFPGSHLDVARELAAAIPEASLMVFDGTSVIPFVGDGGTVLEAVDSFLGPEGVTGRRLPLPQSGGASALRTILFTDMEGHTEMTHRLGDARAREVLRAHERITREALRAHGGTEVKSLGDGFMASFVSATSALECAMALQRGFEAHARGVGAGSESFRVRVGINAGEPIAEDGDIFGIPVIAASRVAHEAIGGQVFVANVVRELVQGKGFPFEDRGERKLQGFDEPVHIWELRWDV
jgi:class 3 adenylate cyclase/pimeloyl-ACP methyl ester carboxylesterase